MFKLSAGLAGSFLFGMMLAVPASHAADLPARHQTADAPVRRLEGVCPCYTYTVKHRVLLSTYGTGFDPNNYDFTEPHYYLGGVKVFRRYSSTPDY